MRKLYIEGNVGYWVDKEGDHVYHEATEDDLCARISALEAALRMIASYTGGDSAAWAAKQMAIVALGTTAETVAEPACNCGYGCPPGQGCRHP